MLNLESEKQKQAELSRKALAQMQAKFNGFTQKLKDDYGVEGLDRKAQETIRNHPWAAAGAALGVGFLAAQLLRVIPTSTPQLPAQHVVVELKHPDGSVTPIQTAAPAPPSVFTGLMAAAATAAYGAVRPMVEKLIHEAVSSTPAPAAPVTNHGPQGDTAAPV